MSRVEHYGHGVFCEGCQEVYDGTDKCDHDLSRFMGIQEKVDGEYIATPADMGHYTPHQWVKVDGMDTCGHCGAKRIPTEMIDE